MGKRYDDLNGKIGDCEQSTLILYSQISSLLVSVHSFIYSFIQSFVVSPNFIFNKALEIKKMLSIVLQAGTKHRDDT